MKQIHLFKKGFVIFFKGATFSDFFETRISNYKPLAIRIRFPLIWGIFFQLGSNLIKQQLGGYRHPVNRRTSITMFREQKSRGFFLELFNPRGYITMLLLGTAGIFYQGTTDVQSLTSGQHNLIFVSSIFAKSLPQKEKNIYFCC